MKIQRWAWWANPEDMVMEPTGEYVLYEDHLKAMDELRAELAGTTPLIGLPVIDPSLMEVGK